MILKRQTMITVIVGRVWHCSCDKVEKTPDASSHITTQAQGLAMMGELVLPSLTWMSHSFYCRPPKNS
jgi:hypothetical protein